MQPGNLSILIPYEELVRLCDAAKEMDSLRADYKRIVDRLAALQGLYSELLDKVNELEQYV